MLKGPLLMLAGIGLFGLLDAISKSLSAEHAVWQVLLVRFITILGAVALLRMLRPGWGGPLHVARPALQALRAVVMLGSAISFFMAFSHLPLVEGYLVFFTSPFFVLALSALTLNEAPPRAAWLWVGFGFSGVMLGLAPGLDRRVARQPRGLCLGAVGHALLLRGLRAEPAAAGEQGIAVVLVWPAIFGFAMMLMLGITHWVAPSAAALGLMVANGVIVAVATVALALAFRHATAARLAPFGYSGLVWSLIYDLLLFGHAPAWPLFAGAAIVVVGCVMSERAARAA